MAFTGDRQTQSLAGQFAGWLRPPPAPCCRRPTRLAQPPFSLGLSFSLLVWGRLDRIVGDGRTQRPRWWSPRRQHAPLPLFPSNGCSEGQGREPPPIRDLSPWPSKGFNPFVLFSPIFRLFLLQLIITPAHCTINSIFQSLNLKL